MTLRVENIEFPMQHTLNSYICRSLKTKTMISRTTGILVGASLFAFTMFSSCGGMNGKNGVDTTSLKEALEKAVAQTKEVTIESGGYKINIPKHMSVSTELNDEAALQYANTSDELYIIIIDESKTEYIKEYSDANLYDDKLTPEKNYRMTQMEAMSEKMTVKGEPVVKKQTINGLDAEVVSFTGQVPGIDFDIFYKLAFIEGTKNIYMVMTWTLDSKKSSNEDEMNEMIKSFKLAE